MRVRIVDAFTDRPFAGNPAGVCVLDSPAPERWMRDVAAELNLSETAFAVRTDDPARFGLRWFTPTTEVDLCGHATLATAHVLRADGAAGPFAFDTPSGPLRASAGPDGDVVLELPARPTAPLAGELAAQLHPHLRAALGAEPVELETDGVDLLVRVDDEGHVRAMSPDVSALSLVDARCVVVTAAVERRPLAEDVVLPGAQGPAPDAVSRVFAPRVGVPEDPVTGSAHCALAPFWASRTGRDELVFHQVSTRGGRLRARLAGERVLLSGRAVTVLDGELLPPVR